jgi:hypothetical protein
MSRLDRLGDPTVGPRVCNTTYNNRETQRAHRSRQYADPKARIADQILAEATAEVLNEIRRDRLQWFSTSCAHQDLPTHIHNIHRLEGRAYVPFWVGCYDWLFCVALLSRALRIGVSALVRSDLVAVLVASRKCRRMPSRCVMASFR